MSWNPFSRNNKASSYPRTQSNPSKSKIILITIVSGVLILGVPVFVTLRNKPSKSDKYTKSATEAARKVTPNAKVRNVKVAGGFAIAIVSDSTGEGQIRVGNITIFKVNEDESMTQIASGSYFSPLDLLGLGIPLATQAELTEASLDQVMQNLASACGYNGADAPGYSGFDGSFAPDEWEIDSNTLGGVEGALTAEVSNKNVTKPSTEKVICVRATKNNSNVTTDMKTYISTFTLELQFISANAAMNTRTFTFSIGPKHAQTYTLDGQKLTYDPNLDDTYDGCVDVCPANP